ncbi:MAG: cytochrome-c oxidase, cbb3-type subunit III [Magnetococcales bacterium]|nr:cytochrome-c oxidase, cbb3-type subunit III [Magnetococcales bacterium]
MADNKKETVKETVETTGHQWDDDEGYPLKEYNNPLPRWWLYTFYATIVWSVIYWILYPAWPLVNDYTRGVLGWSQYSQLEEELAEAREMQKVWDDKLATLSLEQISNDNTLLQYAISGGKAVFGDNCAPCHGSGGVGSHAKGFPALVDDDWLFGGTLADIEESVQNGRTGTMPAHEEKYDGALNAQQVDVLTDYVLSLSGLGHDAQKAVAGKELFEGEAACVVCHGDSGKGSLKDVAFGDPIDRSVGAPDLTDAIWLYGGDRTTIRTSIAKGRTGKMPAWGEGFSGFGRKLDPLSIKEVTLYVHSLGGGR